jgi:hypothetical protein
VGFGFTRQLDASPVFTRIGFLGKKGGWRKNWLRRCFVIDGTAEVGFSLQVRKLGQLQACTAVFSPECMASILGQLASSGPT